MECCVECLNRRPQNHDPDLNPWMTLGQGDGRASGPHALYTKLRKIPRCLYQNMLYYSDGVLNPCCRPFSTCLLWMNEPFYCNRTVESWQTHNLQLRLHMNTELWLHLKGEMYNSHVRIHIEINIVHLLFSLTIPCFFILIIWDTKSHQATPVTEICKNTEEYSKGWQSHRYHVAFSLFENHALENFILKIIQIVENGWSGHP